MLRQNVFPTVNQNYITTFTILSVLSIALVFALATSTDDRGSHDATGHTADVQDSPGLPESIVGIPIDVAGWVQQMTLQIGRNEYTISKSSGVPQAPNRAAGLRTFFRSDGIEMFHRDDAAQSNPVFSWQTTAWGRDGQMRRVGTATRELLGSRVEYRYAGGLQEWYENRPDAIEQGWRLDARPDGQGALVITGRLPTASHADLAVDKQSIAISVSDNQEPIQYGNLHVFDASGLEVPAHLAVVAGHVEIRIDDHDAVYPLMVDPTITPSWYFTPDNGAYYSLDHFTFSTAGDVDGDGYSDVIVGVEDYDAGQTNEGAVFVFHGRPTGLQTSWDWAAYGDQAGAYFGSSVSTAGDIDGDGYDDVIIGAALWDEGEHFSVDRGKICAYLGSSTGLESLPVWTSFGVHVNARLGQVVATAGDVNGDDLSDILVADCSYNGAPRSASVYAYLGSSNGPETNPCWTDSTHTWQVGFGTAGDVNGNGRDEIFLSDRYLNTIHVYHGNSMGIDMFPTISLVPHYSFFDSYGDHVSTAGDVNGDGYGDLLVGDPSHREFTSEPPYWVWYGRAMIYNGSEDGLSGTPDWDILGEASSQVGTGFGHTATAGDYNGDGYADVIIGEPAYRTPPELSEGRFFVYLGSASGCTTTPEFQAEATASIWDYGGIVATAGDVNGDGFSDLLIGARANPGAALVYGFYGASLPPAQTPVLSRLGGGVGRHMGRSVTAAGDFNGDGHDDIVVGIPGYLNAVGRVEAYTGSESGMGTSPAWSYIGDQYDAQLGFAVAAAGDVDGDGYTDIIVGEPYRDTRRGRILLFLGGYGGLPGSPDWTANGTHDHEQFGYSVAWAGDVNSDGYGDVIVGAPGYSNGEGGEGRAVLYLGSDAGLIPSPWQYETDIAGTGLGYSVAWAGDVDKNGYSDVVIGAPYYSGTLAQQGRAYLFRGSSIGLAAEPAWTFEGEQYISFLGWSVAGTGDVNGDGYSDILIGAPGYGADSGQPSTGRAYLFRGYSMGIQEPALWTGTGFQLGQQFGWSVASAGDVNCDACSDILIGLPGISIARLYYGSLYSTPGSTPDWEVNMGGGSAFGACVAMAGDVNADGFGDIVVGAPDHDGGMDEQGSFHVYLGNGKSIGNPGLTIRPTQYRAGYDYLDLLGDSHDPNGVLLSVYGRNAFGRARLRLETRMATMAYSPLNMPVHIGDWYLALVSTWGAYRHLEHQYTNLTTDSGYHWQMRIAGDSPFFPHSPWFSMSRSAAYQKHFKTAGGTGLPDLHVVQIDPDDMPAGSPVTVTIHVHNAGPGAAGSSSTSLALDGAVQCGAIPTPALPGGQLTTITCQLDPVAEGLHALTACTDAGDDVIESDEGNNCSTEELNAISSDEIVVDPGGGGDVTSLAAALELILDGGVIMLAPGIYTGDGNRDLDFGGLNITLRPMARDEEPCIIDCGGSAAEPHRAFYFHSGESSATVIEGITITGGYADDGGAVYCSGSSPTFNEVIFMGNQATDDGGALYLDGSSSTVTGCEFLNNTSSAGGGCAALNSSTPTVEHCRFEGNTAGGGGGFYLHGSIATIADCTVVGNDATWGGGGYCTEGADASIMGCTFAVNSVENGGGAFSIVNAAPVLANCILAFNTGPAQVIVCYSGGDPTLTCCDVYGNEGGDWVGCLSGQLGVDGNVSTDPMFCDHTGGDFFLHSDSDCTEQNSGCGQIGSLDVGCGFHHLLNADGNGDFPTIQAALDAASFRDVIELANGVYTGDGNRDLDYAGKAVTVCSQTGLPDYCIIDCEGSTSENHRAFYFHSGENPDSVLRGITITGGFATSGGGILVTSDGNPTIEDCVFVWNHSASGSGGGGGLCCSLGSAIVTNCRFENNTAVNAGGGMSINTGAPLVTDCEFIMNTAVWGGGGTYNNNGTPVFTRCLFVGNSCDNMGGGMHDTSAGAHSVIDHCTFSANTAPQGSGLFNRINAQSDLTNTIIAFGEQGSAVYCTGDAGPVELSCCDIFGNSGGDWTGCISSQLGVDGNLSLNPWFCDPEIRDFSVAADSPCLPDNNDCGELIGALGEGCTEVGVSQEEDVPLPTAFALEQNYPNPFNPVTTIKFDLPSLAQTRLAVYSVDGQLVRMLVSEVMPAGRYSVTWDGADSNGRRIASGTYFYRLVAGAFVKTGRMALVK